MKIYAGGQTSERLLGDCQSVNPPVKQGDAESAWSSDPAKRPIGSDAGRYVCQSTIRP